MSGTRSHSRTEPATEDRLTGEPGRWPVWKLAILLYPFAATAVWINLFMLFLLLSWLGIDVLSPWLAALLALPLGIPATWAAGIWIRRLMDQAAPRSPIS
ncbi:hypothetical protein [Paracoccus lutimaris]|uniref:Uncharacterized protein n=1 Tax=Paracoccus lutimaris TaxID=1490030 RepID=A0A368YJM3_9RHOB|nr:hypothetical protein [Paracoccus lutimaris]RCW80442.1 hypothetical protein DFP89_1191 [Paracoccus lutimaris]